MYTENFMSVMVMPISVISDLKNKLQNNNALFVSNTNINQNVKTKKINNILDISKNYDYYFFDAYGVFWDGSKIMTNVIDEMEELKKQGKKVVILSNTTQLHDKAEASYAKRGLLQGKHYDLFVTSGDVFKSKVLDGSVKEFIANSSTNKILRDNPKIYVHGAPNAALFEGSNFEITKNLDEADAVYLSIFGGKAFYDEFDIDQAENNDDDIEAELSKPSTPDNLKNIASLAASKLGWLSNAGIIKNVDAEASVKTDKVTEIIITITRPDDVTEKYSLIWDKEQSELKRFGEIYGRV